jgi:hypothetical protein
MRVGAGILAASLLPGLLFACSTGTAPGDARSDAATASDGAATLPVVSPAVARVRIDHVYLCCAECDAPYLPVEYDRSSRTMMWPACPADGGGAIGHVPVRPSPDGGAVSRVLSAAEAMSVESALAALTYVEVPDCWGEDGEDYYLTTFVASGAEIREYTYHDINCVKLPQSLGIADLYALLVMLRG